MEMRTFSNVYSKQWDIANINYATYTKMVINIATSRLKATTHTNNSTYTWWFRVEMSMNNFQSHPYGKTDKISAKQSEKVDTFWFA